jgi:UDP-3-O-[3-hydroxymyristoyl] glucosamine N-acyltransferase
MAEIAEELAELIGADLEGDPNWKVNACAAPEAATAGDLIFVEGEKHADAARRSQAGCVIAPPGISFRGKTVLRSATPKLAFAKAAAILHPLALIAQGIHPTAIISGKARLGRDVAVGPYAVVEDDAEIGAWTQIGPYAFIGREVSVGSECRLNARVTLYARVSIGARALIHSGVVVGADGFGLVRDEKTYVKFPQIGTVEIGDDVEIGANTTIDRGALGTTRLGNGVKIDNLVHIAHNVQIGENTAISAQTGIAGSTIIGKDCVIGGQVGMGDHCRIEDGAILGSKCGVLPGKIIKGGIPVWGIPAKPLPKYKEINFYHDRLPELAARVKALEAKKPKGKRTRKP